MYLQYFKKGKSNLLQIYNIESGFKHTITVYRDVKPQSKEKNTITDVKLVDSDSEKSQKSISHITSNDRHR